MKRQQGGFTLIELVVVIIIVAVLAAASVPIYRNYVQRAMGAEAYALAGSIHSAMKTYYAERADIPPAIAATSESKLLGLDVRSNKYFRTFTTARTDADTYAATITGSGDAGTMTLTVSAGEMTTVNASGSPQTIDVSWD